MAARRSKQKGRSAAADAGAARANREFVAEAEEVLERMVEDLSELDEQRHAGREIDPDLVNRIFRSAHSLKGLAGMFGLDAVSELSHHLEEILDGLRLGRVSVASPAVDLLEEGVGLLAGMMTRLERGEASEGDDATTTRDFIARIEAAVRQPLAETGDELDGLEIEPSLLRALTEYEEHRLRESLRRGRDLVLVDSTFEIVAFEEGLSELSAALREVGEVVSTLPSPGAAPESQIRFSLLVATDIDIERLGARLELPNTAVRSIRSGSAPSGAFASAHTGMVQSEAASEPPSDPRSESQPEAAPADSRAPDPAPIGAEPSRTSEAAPIGAEPSRTSEADGSSPAVPGSGSTAAAEREPPPSADAPEIESLRSISDTVRVDIRKLDELMNLVGELVIQRNAIAGVANRLSANAETARVGAELAKAHKSLDRKLKELQTGVLDVRMVPLRQIFEKLSRVVRRLRRDLDKEVDLDFSGSDTELDKLIVEQLVDPLVHVVRNAFDHALEPAPEREAAGKPARGRIRVAAFQRGNHVVIEVADDGRGMSVEAIRAAATERGLIAEGEALSSREILNLAFEAGLSTAESVTETSGRGVGMDVVRTNLAEMGGMVDLASQPGRGTCVTITLPITLAIIQALVVGVGEERFAIPLNSVLETLVIEPEQIGRSEGREVLNLRGEPLLLQRLGLAFEIPCAGSEERQFVVVLGMGEQRLGLLVDCLEGQQDAVIKPIKGPVQQHRGIAGATELGDRGAVLVIDVSALVADSARRREAA